MKKNIRKITAVIFALTAASAGFFYGTQARYVEQYEIGKLSDQEADVAKWRVKQEVGTDTNWVNVSVEVDSGGKYVIPGSQGYQIFTIKSNDTEQTEVAHKIQIENSEFIVKESSDGTNWTELKVETGTKYEAVKNALQFQLLVDNAYFGQSKADAWITADVVLGELKDITFNYSAPNLQESHTIRINWKWPESDKHIEGTSTQASYQFEFAFDIKAVQID
jgi:hypothetical protein